MYLPVLWRNFTWLIFFSLLLISCGGSKIVSATDPLPTPTPSPNEPKAQPKPLAPTVYHESQKRPWDLDHTLLRLSFDWEQQAVIGEAELQLHPLFFQQDSVHLDARGFEIHRIGRMDPNGMRELAWDYDSTVIHIALDRSFSRQDTLSLYLSYTARPAALDSLGLEEGAGQGLYFINPDGRDPNKPQQIWTQGETQANSCWFPTFDQPNERSTQEVFLTVQDRFTTLSNGILVSSEALKDSLRTDHWRMDLPHAPYLFMLAVGEFAVVKDEWRGREVSYYVEPAYEPYAQMVFGRTPEMLEFYSELLGVEYPWPKYAQVVVRDFVSGAMENTSATIHTEELQHDDRSHIDESYEDYVSHELFHQWFGDLVTCESWANLAMNEGFATYGEYLWIEHAYGPDEAARHLLEDRANYLHEARYAGHDLIHFGYLDREKMFDNHSYAKGGQIVHMLRHHLGDEAFFAAVRAYLQRHAFSAVEGHDLRLAFEETLGQDFNWFFNQWFYASGHPVLEVKHLQEVSSYRLEVHQAQQAPTPEVFSFPLQVGIQRNGHYQEQSFWIDRADTTLELNLSGPVDFVALNADGVLLSQIRESEKTVAQWLSQLESGTNHYQQIAAWEAIKAMDNDSLLLLAMRQGMEASFWGLRQEVATRPRFEHKECYEEAARVLMPLLADSNAAVKSAVLSFFRKFDEEDLEAWAWQEEEQSQLLSWLDAAAHDKSYRVERTAVQVMYALSPTKGVALARNLLPMAPDFQKTHYVQILAEVNDPVVIKTCAELLTSHGMSDKIGAYNALGTLGSKFESSEAIDRLKQAAVEEDPWWMRMMVARAMKDLTPNEDLLLFYQERAAAEDNNQLKKLWESMGSQAN